MDQQKRQFRNACWDGLGFSLLFKVLAREVLNYAATTH